MKGTKAMIAEMYEYHDDFVNGMSDCIPLGVVAGAEEFRAMVVAESNGNQLVPVETGPLPGTVCGFKWTDNGREFGAYLYDV
jgi:hypothetical protein